jgi:hypothetical protein
VLPIFANGAATSAFQSAVGQDWKGGGVEVQGATGDGEGESEINLVLSKLGKEHLSEDFEGGLVLTGDVAYPAGNPKSKEMAQEFVTGLNGEYAATSSDGKSTIKLTVNLTLVDDGIGDFIVFSELSDFTDTIGYSSRQRRELKSGQCSKSCSATYGGRGLLYFRWGGQKYYGLHETFHNLGFKLPHTKFGVMQDEGKSADLDYRELQGLRDQLYGTY